MLNFIVPWKQKWIFQNLKNRLHSDQSSSLSFFAYHDLYRKQKLKPGIYIFTGYGVLTNVQKEVGLQLSKQLQKAGSDFIIMNHPEKVLDRYELLETLYHLGYNQFRAYKIHEILSDSVKPGFPVFIREAGRHSGSLTGLLTNSDSMIKKIHELKKSGFKYDHLLVVEFIDTADNRGIYKKYSAFRLGDTILPRYLSLSYDWVVKENASERPGYTLYDEDVIKEELLYIHNNPHQQLLKEIFQIANIEYGRIDYGFKDGKLQVWEINTLPTIGAHPRVSKPPKSVSGGIVERKLKRAAAKEHFYHGINEAIKNIYPITSPQYVSITLSKQLQRRILREKSKHMFTNAMLNTGIHLPRLIFFQNLRTAVIARLKKVIQR